MTETLTLYGYRYSVYTRIAQLALVAKGATYDSVEIDPFTDPDPSYHMIHPFGRVPALMHGSFTLYETRAITSHIDRVVPGASLRPTDDRAISRMEQVISVVDSYGYWPMVRQVFAHRVFRPLLDELPDEDEIATGIAASKEILTALNQIASEGLVLNGEAFTLADCHLAPMIDYFIRADEGRQALSLHPALSRWWDQVSQLPAVRATDPKLSEIIG